jgi:hypothetical protein
MSHKLTVSFLRYEGRRPVKSQSFSKYYEMQFFSWISWEELCDIQAAYLLESCQKLLPQDESGPWGSPQRAIQYLDKMIFKFELIPIGGDANSPTGLVGSDKSCG